MIKAKIKPYDDERLEYDKKAHRYILTMDACNEYVDLLSVYSDEDTAQRVLRDVARTIYTWIYSRGNRNNKPYIEYVLSHNEECRELIFDAMLSQLIADTKSGIQDVKDQVGINFETGNVLNRRDQKERVISIEAEQIIINGVPDLNLVFTGDYNVRLPDNRYESWDY